MTVLITYYWKIATNHDKNLLQITTVGYNKLQQLYYTKIYYKYGKELLQISAALIFVKFNIITNYVKFYYKSRQQLQCYYKLRSILLQTTATITNYDVITNYVVILISWKGRWKKSILKIVLKTLFFQRIRKRFIVNMDFISEFLKKDYTTHFLKFDFEKENIIHYNVELDWAMCYFYVRIANVEKYH